MKEPKIMILEDNLGIQDLLRDTIGRRYNNCTITADPMEVLMYKFDCGIFDYNLGINITGQMVAEKVRRMYGDKVFLISHTSEFLSDLEKEVYDVCLRKPEKMSVIYDVFYEFDRRYKK